MLVPSQMTQMHQTQDEWSLCVLHSRTYKGGEEGNIVMGKRDCPSIHVRGKGGKGEGCTW